MLLQETDLLDFFEERYLSNRDNKSPMIDWQEVIQYSRMKRCVMCEIVWEVTTHVHM